MSVEVIGTPFSTFTRTITMSLHEKQAQFKQHDCMPHSAPVLEHSPFGFIPIFIHNTEFNKLVLYETLAISRYIDVTFEGYLLRPNDLLDNVEVDKWISIASSVVFNTLEHGVIKPRLSAQKNEKSEIEIKNIVQSGVEKAESLFSKLEQLFAGPYVCGDELTWADLFLYPPFADYEAIPEGKQLKNYPKLSAWLDTMRERESVRLTFDGTFSS